MKPIAYYHVNFSLKKKNPKKILKADVLTKKLIYILPSAMCSVANVKFVTATLKQGHICVHAACLCVIAVSG